MSRGPGPGWRGYKPSPPPQHPERGLIQEITDGTGTGYRANLFHDLAKAAAIRLALAQAEELRHHGVAALALTPGFLRSQAALDHFGVAEGNWRDAIDKHPDFWASQTPAYIGRAGVALASNPDIMTRAEEAVSTWQLAREYSFTDRDGGRLDWGRALRRYRGVTGSQIEACVTFRATRASGLDRCCGRRQEQGRWYAARAGAPRSPGSPARRPLATPIAGRYPRVLLDSPVLDGEAEHLPARMENSRSGGSHRPASFQRRVPGR
jgi:hypothetical protein